jgi:D-glycero-alpha-D-manno-heptose-7-phosphate kinase
MYIMIHPYFHDKIRIKYSKTEDVQEIEEIRHPLVRECLRISGIHKGIEIASIADVPAGTGLGSSSSFTVCLLHALYAYKGKFVTKEKLAQEACCIEMDVLKKPIGKQDQYASSCGNLNFIQFNADGSVFVDPIIMNAEVKNRLEKNLMMFYVGNDRNANLILESQVKNMGRKEILDLVQEQVKLAQSVKQTLQKGKLDDVGVLLHEGWTHKKKLADNISNPFLDAIYSRALDAGVSGGKLLGAGGGGFFLFFCEPKYQDNVKKKLELRELDFKFDSEGSKIIFFES